MRKNKLTFIPVITIIASMHFFACSHGNKGGEQMQYVYDEPSVKIEGIAN